MATARVLERRHLLIGAVLVALASVVAVAWVYDSTHGEGANGTGFTYRGVFYSQSDAEVAPDRLGAVLDRGVPIRDTTADVREITGIDVETAVAAQVGAVGPDTATDGSPPTGWVLMSSEPTLAADPWADPELSQVVRTARP